MLNWLRRLRAESGEWSWCLRCRKLTLSWFCKVRHFGELQRRPICSVCLAWKPYDP